MRETDSYRCKIVVSLLACALWVSAAEAAERTETTANTAGLPVRTVHRFGEERPKPGGMAKPNLEYFFTPDLPLEPTNTIGYPGHHDAPAITNNWMHIQAANGRHWHVGILNASSVP